MRRLALALALAVAITGCHKSIPMDEAQASVIACGSVELTYISMRTDNIIQVRCDDESYHEFELTSAGTLSSWKKDID